MSDDKPVSNNKEEKEQKGRDDGYCSSNESDFDLQPNAFLQSCPHLDSLHESANICDPSLWHCRECSTTESVWVCLSCGYFGCGRYQNGHAKIHFQQTGHPLVLEINEKLCYCYPCKNYVTNDTPEGAISKIRQKLEEEQTQRDHANKRKKLRSSAIFKKSPSSFEKQDKLVTIIQQWKMYHLYRAFNKWKHVWKANKSNKIDGHGENSVSTSQNTHVNEIKSDVTDVTMNDVENNTNKTKNSKTTSKSSKKRAREETEDETKAAENEGNKKPKKRKTEKEPSVVLRKIIKPGETGLRNLGNTCYMNSILQSLSNTTLFRDYFLWHLIPRDKPAVINKHVLHREPTVNIITSISKSPVKHGDEVLLTKEIHNLLRVMWSGKWAVVTPYSLLQGVWTCLPKFHSHQQQDVQEFLCYLLDRVNSELMGDKNAQNSAPASSESKAKLRKSFSSLRMSLTGKPINSIINEVFEGQLLSEIRCMQCGHRSNKKDPFLDLSLEIPEQFVQTSSRASRHKKVNLSCDLSECIDGFMRAEELGPDSYWCEQCKAKRNATKKFYIARPPKVLVLVIKRFCWTTSARAKVDTQIRFPLKSLDVAPYLYQDATANGNGADATSTSTATTRYNLRSLIVHHGVRLLSGHYSCYCFNDEKAAWVHFNDTQVTVETPEEVESAQPYMLFYEREDTEPSNRAQEPMSEEDLDVRMLDLSMEVEEEDEATEAKNTKRVEEAKSEPKPVEVAEPKEINDVPKKSAKPATKPAPAKKAAPKSSKIPKTVKKEQHSLDEEPEEKTADLSTAGSEKESSDNDNNTRVNNNKNNNNSDDQDEDLSQEEQASEEGSESDETPPKNKSRAKAQPKKTPTKTPTKAADKKKAPARKPAPTPKTAPKKATAKKASNATTKTIKATGTKSNSKSRNTKTTTEIPKKSTTAVTTRSSKKAATSATSEPKTASRTTKKTRRR